MVSIRGGLTLVALAVGVVLFFGAGGFSGVGQKIGGFFGGGARDFSSSLTSAFTGGLFGGNAGASNVGNQQGTTQGSQNQPETTFGQFLDFANPITNQLSIFQGIIDQLKNIGNFGQQVFGQTPLTRSQRTTSFAISQLREGQTQADITIKPPQGTAVARTGMRFVSNLGGRERAFGSQESLNSFIERFNR